MRFFGYHRDESFQAVPHFVEVWTSVDTPTFAGNQS